jgi:uncharacterized protein YyaL (SSP411 family)
VLLTKDNKETLSQLSSLVVGKDQINQQPTAYICQNFSCQAPVTTLEEFEVELK